MKKFTLLLASMAIMPALFAFAYSELTITINENADFYVIVDNRQYDSYAGSVVIPHLSNGNRNIEVYKNRMVLDGIVSERVFAGYVSIAPNRKIYATIDRFGAFVILSSENLNPVFEYDGSHGNGHGTGHGHHNNGCNGAYGNSPYSSGGYIPMGMSPESFGMLLSSMRREAFDDTRVRMAIAAVSMSRVTSAQLRELMLMLTFDSNRLKLAKMSYVYVVDKGNIFLINDAFTFTSNADEFYRYIGF